MTAFVSPSSRNDADSDALLHRYRRIRAQTEALCELLEIEDFGLQSMPDCSPPKWHLAHTTWFFETFILETHVKGYQPFHTQFGYLFNSYYESVGRMHPRPQRGLLSRPTVREIYQYRAYVDDAMTRLLERELLAPDQLDVVDLGLHHEQQHQELFFTDLKHGFGHNPLRPRYQAIARTPQTTATPRTWIDHHGGVAGIGHRGSGFAFDNEGPRHRVFLEPFGLSSRLVTNGEYIEFINDQGYQRADLWLSQGWSRVQSEGWNAPLYWERRDGEWWHFTLGGMQPVAPQEPVCHVSLYEAEAFAAWTGYRLPTEFEWEVLANQTCTGDNFLETGVLHPRPARQNGLTQMLGDVWEWTRSAYAPYPAYRAPAGALGEYNGKFMCSQSVLRGGSCVTPHSHIRTTYRNFFYPADRWQFSGIRLARDLSRMT